VSDFIARVAARAVGERLASSPRAPALLEAAGPGIEVIDEEVVVPAADRTVVGVPALAPKSPGELSAHSATPPPLPVESAAGRDPSDASFEQPSPEASPPPPRHLSDPARERVPSPQPTAPPRTRRERRAPAEVAVASPMPTPSILASVPAHVVPAPVAAPAEPPAVRVHIGRLEVRADLQEQPQPAERAPAPEPQERSLSDYLRGRRERR